MVNNFPSSEFRFDSTNPRISISATSVHSPTIVQGPQSPVHSIHPKTSMDMFKRVSSDSSLPIDANTKTMAERFKESEPFPCAEPPAEKGAFSEEKECVAEAAPAIETTLPLCIRRGAETLRPEGTSMGVEALRDSIVSASSNAPIHLNSSGNGSPSSTRGIKSPFLTQDKVSQETVPRVCIPTVSRSPSLAQLGGRDTTRVASMFSLEDDNDEAWPSGEDDGIDTPVVIAAAYQAQMRRPVMVNNAVSSKESRNILRKERTRPISNMSVKAARILGQKSPLPLLRREDAFIAMEAAPLKTPLSPPILYHGPGGTEAYAARTRSFLDTDLETADGLASLNTFHSARKLSLSEALHSHPPDSLDTPAPFVGPKRASTLPNRKRKTPFTPPPIDPKPGKRFHRQSVISTPYSEFENGKHREFSFPKDEEDVQLKENSFTPEAILTVVLYSQSSPVPKLSRIAIPPSCAEENRLSTDTWSIPHSYLTRFVPSFPFTKIPIAKLHPARPPPFDDAALFTALRKEYLKMRGPLRVFLSARTLTSIDLLSYKSTSQLCTRDKVSLRTKTFRVVDDCFAESNLLSLFRHPSLGRGAQEWVSWVRGLPSSTSSSSMSAAGPSNEKDLEADPPTALPTGYKHSSRQIAFEFVEGWSVPRIGMAILLVLVLSILATLLWVFIGVGGNTNFAVSVQGTKVVENWKVSGMGFRGVGGRVEAGCILGALVLGVGWTGVGGWAVLSWLVI